MSETTKQLRPSLYFTQGVQVRKRMDEESVLVAEALALSDAERIAKALNQFETKP